MGNLHYEFTGETKEFLGKTLNRIVATKDLPARGVKKGDLGGWIEKEYNLDGNAWVRYSAIVCGDAQVYGNAEIYGDAIVSGEAIVFGNSRICGNAWVKGNVTICEDAQVESMYDFCNFNGVCGEFSSTTFFKTRNGDVFVKSDYFLGTLKEFENKETDDTEYKNEYEERQMMINLVKLKFNL